MTWSDGTPYVDELSTGVYAYVQPDGGWMVNNCGVDRRRQRHGGAGRHHLDRAAQPGRARPRSPRCRTGAPKAVVNTHHHPDHTYGNGFLPAETLVIGHEKCRDEVLAAGLEATKVITAPDYGNLTLRPPELTFADRMTLHLEELPGRAAARRRPGAHQQRRAGLAAGAAGAVRRRPGVRGRSAVPAGGLGRRLPQRDRPDAGARRRRCWCPVTDRCAAARRCGGCWTRWTPTSAYVERRRRRVVRGRPDPARGGAEAPRQPVPRLGRDRAVRREPAPGVLRAVRQPDRHPASPCPRCGRTWSPSTAARSPATHEPRGCRA